MEDVGKWNSLIYGWKKYKLVQSLWRATLSHMISIYLFPTSIWESLYLDLINNCMYKHIYAPAYLYTYMYKIWEFYSKKYIFCSVLLLLASRLVQDGNHQRSTSLDNGSFSSCGHLDGSLNVWPSINIQHTNVHPGIDAGLQSSKIEVPTFM